jgi:hypothetical protein
MEEPQEKDLNDFQKLLLVYRVASDLRKYSIEDKLVPHYLLFLNKLGGPKTNFSYYNGVDGPYFKESPIRDLREGGNLASSDGKNHFLTPKGAKYTEELVVEFPKTYESTYESIKRILPHLINVENELPFLSQLLSQMY